MSSKITVKPHAGVGTIGLISIIAGLVMILVGGAAWGLVASQLAAENITVSADSKFLANKNVNDPFSAFAQANSINEHAQAMSGGKTYAELEKEDPMREVVMNASFLRASLFTSVVAFGVSAFVVMVGLLTMITGWALRRMAGGPPLVIETTDSGPVEFEKLARGKGEKSAEVATPSAEAAAPPAKEAGAVTSTPASQQQVPVSKPSDPTPLRNRAEPGQATPGQPVRAAQNGSSDGYVPLNPSPFGAPRTPKTDLPVEPRTTSNGTESRASAIPTSESKPTGRPLRANTGTIPVVAFPPSEPKTADEPKNGNSSADNNAVPAPSEQPEATRPTGANGWSSPADRLPKQPEK